MLEIGRLASRKAPIVDKAAASERLNQYIFLLSRGIEPIRVGPLVHLLAFLIFDILRDGGVGHALKVITQTN